MLNYGYKLYDLELNFIKDTNHIPENFTGMSYCINDKTKWWRKNYDAHRIGGPAKIWDKNDPHYRDPLYYIDGKRVTKEYHDILFNIMKLKGLI